MKIKKAENGYIIIIGEGFLDKTKEIVAKTDKELLEAIKNNLK